MNLDENGNRDSRCTEVDVADFRKIQNTPEWTASGTLNYTTPLAGGTLNINSTLSYRSKSQQFEIRTPGIDQKGFALLDASIVYELPGDHWTIGLHGKNLTDTRYKTSGYNFMLQNPYTGEFIGNGIERVANGQPGRESGARPRRRLDRLLRQPAADHVHCRLQALSGEARGAGKRRRPELL